jgi:hypothetical protein
MHFDDTDDVRNNTVAALKAIAQNKFQAAGIGVQLSKKGTLKATTVIFSSEICSTSTALSSRTLLTRMPAFKYHTMKTCWEVEL